LHLCDRRFGIVGDGLLLENDLETDFTWFITDGNQSSMCGNGGGV
jgi:diaminopimelate epimerase